MGYPRNRVVVRRVVERLRQRLALFDFLFPGFPELIYTTIFETVRFMTFKPL